MHCESGGEGEVVEEEEGGAVGAEWKSNMEAKGAERKK